jgi:trigger factor
MAYDDKEDEMNVKIEKMDGCRRALGIVVPADTVREDYDAIVGLFSKQAKISGFRPGKAPVSIVEKRYGKEIVQETKDRLIPQFYQAALEQESLSPVAVIDVQNVEFSRDAGLDFRVIVDLQPEFKMPKYKKISLKREPVVVADEDIERALTEIRERFARFEDVTDQPVASGDLVQVDYAAVSDGKPLGEVADDASDIGEGSDFWVPTGESEFVPGFNAALEGATIGQTLTVDVTFPEDFHVASVAGLSAVYTVEVKGLRTRALPELDAEFLKRFEVESEADLRERIRKDLEEAGAERETARLKNEISKVLLEKTDMDLPQSLVERETTTLIRDMLTRAAKQGGSREMFEQHRDEIMGSASQSARDRVKLSYIVERIGEDQSLEVTDEDVEKRLTLMSQRYGMEVERFRPELEKQDEGLLNLRTEVRGDKVMDFILENAKIKS